MEKGPQERLRSVANGPDCQTIHFLDSETKKWNFNKFYLQKSLIVDRTHLVLVSGKLVLQKPLGAPCTVPVLHGFVQMCISVPVQR